jgi:hypothetical protein
VDLRITNKRFILFATFMLFVVVMLQQCWQNYSPAEKWLYFFEEPARIYAGQVLGPGRGMEVQVPEALAKTDIEVLDNHVVFKPRNDPPVTLAFAPSGKPPDRDGVGWAPLRDGWWVLGSASSP